ncbi:MAG: zinc-dependent alcohol dehydrogenase [Candidatus Humimicrobiaceae bacterium]
MNIPESMLAAVLYKPEDIRIEKRNIKKPGSRDVLIKVKACGICGTDSHIYYGRFPAPNLPYIQGHEFSGEVVDIGGEVQTVKIGDRVTADINISCGKCYFCRMGQKLFCPSIKQIGVHIDGAFAEYITVPEDQIHHLPDNLSWEYGAYVEPLACVLRGQERLNIQPGSTVAIIGAGPMGLAHTIMSNLKGAAKVITSETDPSRLEKARKVGADVVINVSSADPIDMVKKETEGHGADYVIEAVGSILTYTQAFQMVRRGGNLLFYGAAPATAEMPIKPFEIYSKELTIVSSYAGTYHTWTQAINLLASGKFDPSEIITDSVELRNVVEGIKSISSDRKKLKIMVIP